MAIGGRLWNFQKVNLKVPQFTVWLIKQKVKFGNFETSFVMCKYRKSVTCNVNGLLERDERLTVKMGIKTNKSDHKKQNKSSVTVGADLLLLAAVLLLTKKLRCCSKNTTPFSSGINNKIMMV